MDKSAGGEGGKACLEDEWGMFGFGNGKDWLNDNASNTTVSLHIISVVGCGGDV